MKIGSAEDERTYSDEIKRTGEKEKLENYNVKSFKQSNEEKRSTEDARQ